MNIWKVIMIGSLGIAGFAIAGCDQATTRDDVEAAREEYEQQADEAQEAMQDADEQVGEEVREAEQAREELQETEAEFASEQARKDYVEHQNKRLEQFDITVAELKARSEKLEGDQQQSLDEKIAVVEQNIDDAREKLDELESAEVDEWTAKRDDVELAMRQVESSLVEAEAIR